jgi:hypothetical protein
MNKEYDQSSIKSDQRANVMDYRCEDGVFLREKFKPRFAFQQ